MIVQNMCQVQICYSNFQDNALFFWIMSTFFSLAPKNSNNSNNNKNNNKSIKATEIRITQL